MTLDELRDALDGLHAYDMGAVDSGIHDEALRARCRTAIAELPRAPSALVGPDLARIVRDLWLSEAALAQGYGLEDAHGFIQWLTDQMGVPL